MEVTIDYKISYDVKVVRGSATEKQQKEVLKGFYPSAENGRRAILMGVDTRGHTTVGYSQDTPIGEWHESWVLLLEIHLRSWEAKVAE